MCIKKVGARLTHTHARNYTYTHTHTQLNKCTAFGHSFFRRVYNARSLKMLNKKEIKQRNVHVRIKRKKEKKGRVCACVYIYIYNNNKREERESVSVCGVVYVDFL